MSLESCSSIVLESHSSTLKPTSGGESEAAGTEENLPIEQREAIGYLIARYAFVRGNAKQLYVKHAAQGRKVLLCQRYKLWVSGGKRAT